MHIGFAGTPAFAAMILKALVASSHEVTVVLTQPGRPAGRGRKILPGPVQVLCEQHNIPFHTPSKLRGFQTMFEALDALVVAAYGLFLPKSVLTAPKLGCMNVHASLLPRWRGASPIEHAILHGDHETGVSTMQITHQLDAGPVYRRASLPLTPESTTTTMTPLLAELGATQIVQVLNAAAMGNLAQPQYQCEQQATLAPRLTNDAARIDWRQSAVQIERHIRAFHGRGMAFTTLNHAGRTVRVRVLHARVREGAVLPGEVLATANSLIVGCGEDVLALRTVQLNIGKGRPMSSVDSINGFPDLWHSGTRFIQE